MPRRANVFYAYPSNPPAIGETIEQANKRLAQNSEIKKARVRFSTWTDSVVSGKHLWRDIEDRIKRSQVFACDLTYPNPNVSFELGFAIGKFKRIFLSVDEGIEQGPSNFKRYYFDLAPLGYAKYRNREELEAAVLNERPWIDLDKTLLPSFYRRPLARPELPTILYIKPPLPTNAVTATEEILRSSKFGNALRVDDPSENPMPGLDWYAQEMATADAVVVHLLGEEHDTRQPHNIKAAFLSGLAHGLERPLLMLAHVPYDVPVDYHHLLQTHDTAQLCGSILTTWVAQVGQNLPNRRPRRQNTRDFSSGIDLRNISLGDPVAENETESLDEYFVETSSFYRALSAQIVIFVGRKGTGKTAIMLSVESDADRNLAKHATTINPVGYEVDGLVRVITELEERSERGYLIESLWKYLIYSEIALSVQASITERPSYLPRDDSEEAIVRFVESHANIIKRPFSEKLDNAIQSLIGLGLTAGATDQRARISELLHEQLIRDLRIRIGDALSQYDKLAVVIDNLDKPWKPGAHVQQLADMIAGLFSVVQELPRDLRRSGRGLTPVETNIAIMLRSDIFAQIRPFLSEPDKLPVERVSWEDSEMLLKIINQRLVRHAAEGTDAEQVWEALFPAEVDGVPVREFLLASTLPRPRDVIFFLRSAVSKATNRGHSTVMEHDLRDARSEYSHYAFEAVQAEDDPARGKLQEILYEFAVAGETIVTVPTIQTRLAQAGVAIQDTEDYINLLCDTGFLGISGSSGFVYPADEMERTHQRRLASLSARRANTDEVFEINPVFHPELQIV